MNTDHITDAMVEAVEDTVGRAHGGWDETDPKELIAAILTLDALADARAIAAIEQQIGATPATADDWANLVKERDAALAEVARARDILSTPSMLRAHTLNQFPNHVWEPAEFVGRLRAAAERVEALEAERAALPRQLATALWETSALRHGLFTPVEFAGICERAIAQALASRVV